MLKELVKLMDDVDDMFESYAGKDVLAESTAELEKFLSPRIEFDWKNVAFMFLPHQIKDWNALIEATKRLSPDYVGVADIDVHKSFIQALSKYKDFADVKNVGAAIHAMIQAALRSMDESGFSESTNRV